MVRLIPFKSSSTTRAVWRAFYGHTMPLHVDIQLTALACTKDLAELHDKAITTVRPEHDGALELINFGAQVNEDRCIIVAVDDTWFAFSEKCAMDILDSMSGNGEVCSDHA